MDRRPIVYLTAIEDVARSPLIRSQVLAMLKAVAEQHPGRPFVLVALYPIVNVLRFRRQLAAVRTELAEAGIAVHVFPIVFLTRHFYVPWLLLPLYLAQALIWSLWIAFWLQPAIIHCRSYPAAIVGRIVKRLASCRLVFDTRALYPEEGATLAEGHEGDHRNGLHHAD